MLKKTGTGLKTVYRPAGADDLPGINKAKATELDAKAAKLELEAKTSPKKQAAATKARLEADKAAKAVKP